MIKKYLCLTACLFSIISLAGCASLVTGTNQSISVKTGQVADATCSLENNKGKWYVNRTPGSVVVHRSYDDLIVQCKKPGIRAAYIRVASHTKPMAFGNILFGGAVGAGVDVVNGAAYDYPTEIDVPMYHS